MKSEKLMEYIGQIDDNFIIEADIHATKFKSIPSPDYNPLPPLP